MALSTDVVSSTAAGAILVDDFNRVGTTIEQGLGSIPGGPKWQIVAGLWRITNGRPFTATPPDQTPIVVVYTGVNDADVAANLGGGDAIYLRVTDQQNWERVRLVLLTPYPNRTWRLLLESCVENTITERGRVDLQGTRPSRVRFTASGTALRVFLNDLTAPTLAGASQANRAAVWHGIGRAATPADEQLLDLVQINTLNSPPYAPTLTSPVAGGRISNGQVQRFSWVHRDPNSGDPQSAYELQYRLAGAAGWSTVTDQGTAQFRDFASGAFVAGNYEWRVRTYDSRGRIGPFSGSAFFTVGGAPAAATITSPTNGSIMSAPGFEVTWSVANQEAYELARVPASTDGTTALTSTPYDTTGVIVSTSARAASLRFPVQDRVEFVALRVRVNGLWSEWATSRVVVQYTAPLKPGIWAGGDVLTGTIAVTVSHPTPDRGTPAAVTCDFERRILDFEAVRGALSTTIEVVSGVPAGAGFIDFDVSSLVEYDYRAVVHGDNGTITRSVWASEYVPPSPVPPPGFGFGGGLLAGLGKGRPVGYGLNGSLLRGLAGAPAADGSIPSVPVTPVPTPTPVPVPSRPDPTVLSIFVSDVMGVGDDGTFPRSSFRRFATDRMFPTDDTTTPIESGSQARAFMITDNASAGDEFVAPGGARQRSMQVFDSAGGADVLTRGATWARAATDALASTDGTAEVYQPVRGDVAGLVDTTSYNRTGATQPRLTMSNTGMIQRNGVNYRAGGANVFQIINNDYPSSSGRLMSHDEIDELLDRAVTLKARVLRAHTLGVNIGPNAPHLVAGVSGTSSPVISYRSAVWEVMDYAVAAAAQRGLYLMVPMTDELHYYHGGKAQWVDFRRPGTVSLDGNVKSANTSSQRTGEGYFYTDPQIRLDFKTYISDWLNHVNQYTGRAYKNEPAIAVIETGNELWTSGQDAPSWAADLCQYIKGIAPNVLTADGCAADGASLNATSLNSPYVDIFGTHPYTTYGASDVTAQAQQAAGKGKAYHVGEYAWSKSTASAIESAVRGAGNCFWSGPWSLQNDRDLHNGGPGQNYGTDDASLYVPGPDSTQQAAVSRLQSHSQNLQDNAASATPPQAPAALTGTVTDDFTGSNGDTPNTTKWSTSGTSSGSSTTIQSNAARLQTGTGGGYGDKATLISKAEPRANGRLLFDVTPASVGEAYFQASLRSAASDGSIGDVSAYRLEIAGDSGYASIVRRGANPAQVGTGVSVAGWAAGVTVHVDFSVVGSAVKAFLWTGSTKPSTPTISGTNSEVTAAGSAGFVLNGGNAAASRAFSVDALTYDSGA